MVRSKAGWLKCFIVWCYDWWFGENCLKTRFKKLKPPFRNKTTNNDKGQDQNADLEAATSTKAG